MSNGALATATDLDTGTIGTEWHEADLEAACAAGPDGIVVPKVNTPKEVKNLEKALLRYGAPATTRLWAMIETPDAIFRVRKIASASDRLAVLVMGTNDPKAGRASRGRFAICRIW